MPVLAENTQPKWDNWDLASWFSFFFFLFSFFFFVLRVRGDWGWKLGLAMDTYEVAAVRALLRR